MEKNRAALRQKRAIIVGLKCKKQATVLCARARVSI